MEEVKIEIKKKEGISNESLSLNREKIQNYMVTINYKNSGRLEIGQNQVFFLGEGAQWGST